MNIVVCTRLLLLTGLILIQTGCKTTQKPFFPIGIYSVPNTNDFPAIRQAGFNLITGPAEKAYLDAAQKAGLRVLVSLGTEAGKSFKPKIAQEKVARYESHAAVWAWSICDEPDLHLVSPEEVKHANSVIKNTGSKNPTALVIYKGSEALHYGNIADIMMVDRYPVPWLPLASFEQHVQMTRLALGKSKPLVAVIQAFDWSAYPQDLPGESNLRAPTFEEMKCMTYGALAEQIEGLFYFVYDSGKWKMKEQPETWEGLKRVVREIEERMPLFQAKHLWYPALQKFESGFKGWNGALQSSLNTALLQVDKGNSKISPGKYILTVNNSETEFLCSFTAPATIKSEVNVLDEERGIAVEKGQIKDYFAPYDVHIYGPF